jgi:hypothetical protein
LATDWRHDKWFTGKALIRKAGETDRIHYCQLGKMDVKPKGSIKDLLVESLWEQRYLQRLDRLLALIECRDRIDIQVHTHDVARLIGGEFGIPR